MTFLLRHAVTGGWLGRGTNPHAAPYRLTRLREDAVRFEEREEANSVRMDVGSTPTAYELVEVVTERDDAGQFI